MAVGYIKNKRILTVLLCSLLFVVLVLFQSARNGTPVASYFSSHSLSSSSTSSQVTSFWPQFYAALLAATPRCALPHHHIEAGIALFSPGNSWSHRQSLINLPDEDIAELQNAHEWFVSEITSPSFPSPRFTPGSSGVVTTAGGEFLPEALVMIRMLRRTGSTLPVDVFLTNEDEEEPGICETVLRNLGATCHILSQLIDAEGLPRRQNITRYQLKAFALLFSQYDQMVWMDADQMALVDPQTLFDAEPFLSKGLVTWPDYWYPTSSPLFYRIAGIPDEEVPSVGLRAASETGQLLISKSIHLRTLELVAYYNFHGPSHYYKLLSQGAVGEGDKETFLAAAQALKAPYWAVENHIDTIGWSDNGLFRPTGMLQSNPIADYNRAQNGGDEAIPAAFLHSEQHKPNAGRYARLWQEKVKTRMFGPKEAMVEKFGFDMEKVWWDEVVWTACGLNGHVFKDWIDNPMFVDEGDICAQAKAVYEELFADEKGGE